MCNFSIYFIEVYMQEEINELKKMITMYEDFLSSIPENLNKDLYPQIYILKGQLTNFIEKLEKTLSDQEYIFNIQIAYESLSYTFRKTLEDEASNRLHGVMGELDRLSLIHEASKEHIEDIQKRMENQFNNSPKFKN